MVNGYALGQLSRAFLTAVTHEDAVVRARADRRAQRWVQVIESMASGRVEIGSRTPVRGFPAWVTLEVVHGGFATGRAIAESPIEADEIAVARRVGVEPVRSLIFGYYLTADGMAELHELLDTGMFRVDIPEDAALLTVAWLLREGDRDSALELLDQIAPFATRLRFTPRVSPTPTTPLDHVFRASAAEARRALLDRRPQEQVEIQREVLAVWNPFSDRLLTLWLELFTAGRRTVSPTEDWLARARVVLEEYDVLSLAHTRATRHKRAKGNVGIQIASLRVLTDGGELDDRREGLLRASVVASVAKRGAPGSTNHTALREAQREDAETPGHWRLSAVAAERLATVDPYGGLPDPSIFAGPVTTAEAPRAGAPAGSVMPPSVGRALARAHAAPVGQLVDEGVIPSAEVLAELIPQITATTTATGYPAPALARLMAANYRAFRRRRSLLLVDLKKQVQVEELPWVRAASGHHVARTDAALDVARRVGALALDTFPGTIVPNPLVQELNHLLVAGGMDVPLVEELAADIFMGRFSDKYRRAAQIAARVVGGTLYECYYGIDYARIAALDQVRSPVRRVLQRTRKDAAGPSFGDVCWERSGRRDRDRYSVSTNGAVIEQAQILTTHNLAALVEAGVEPCRSWTELADGALSVVTSRLNVASHQERPFGAVKDAAYAWRQMVFFLSLAPASELDPFIRDAEVRHRHARGLSVLLPGLRDAAEGSQPTHPFLGWAAGSGRLLGQGLDLED
ncbi:hypothetical protein [Cellulosimicrobium sp. E-16]|uniref:hypothetical protein n=1 Tax=Cellulosimicrobium sp. E-16 TaxID=3404049 RepID=UPI003CEAAC53